MSGREDSMTGEPLRPGKGQVNEFGGVPRINLEENFPGVVEASSGGGAGGGGVAGPDREAGLKRILTVSDMGVRKQLLTKWMGDNSDAPDDLWNQAQTGLEGRATTRMIEVPKNEPELVLFIRDRAFTKIDEIVDSKLLTVNNLLKEIALSVGIEAEALLVNLFPLELGARRKDVEKQVRKEIEYLCNLRAAELREEELQGTAAKYVTSNYVRDMEGTPESKSNPVEVQNATLDWLKNLRELPGHPGSLSAERIDKAFGVMLWMGEPSNVGVPNVVQTRFLRFKGISNSEGKIRNFFDPDYPPEIKEQFFAELAQVYGDQAKIVAEKLFAGLRCGSMYNRMNYFAQYMQFASNREFMATVLEAPVGSDRLYVDASEREAGHEGHKDELKVVAHSPLQAEVKEGGVKRVGIYMERAKLGKFLRDSEFLTRGTTVERGALPSIKQGDKLRTAIVEIGKLGDKENDKATKVNASVGQLITIASAGRELVDKGVITLDDLRAQIITESRNILWEFSVKNEENMSPGQTKESVKFLLPSGYNKLLELLANAVLDGVSRWERSTLGGRPWPETVDGTPGGTIVKNADRYVIMTDDDMEIIEAIAKSIREASLETLNKLDYVEKEKSDVILDTENKAMDLVMPSIRGNRLIPGYRARVKSRVRSFDSFLDAIPGVPKRPR